MLSTFRLASWIFLVALVSTLFWVILVSTTTKLSISYLDNSWAVLPTQAKSFHRNHSRLKEDISNPFPLPGLAPMIQPIQEPFLPLRQDNRNLSDNQLQRIRSQRILYIITPTYSRDAQLIDLLRLQQTLELAVLDGYHNRIYWILVEDTHNCSTKVREIAMRTSPAIPLAHFAVPTPPVNKQRMHHKGVDQRNAALKLIEQELQAEGVVYFADDDNAYAVQLFTELIHVTHVGVLGVGLVGNSAYERCQVDPETGLVTALLSTWTSVSRKYPIDMAGFAFATVHLAIQQPKVRFRKYSKPGFLESDFVQQMVQDVHELQPLAGNCTRIMVWHVKTTVPGLEIETVSMEP